jgi:hypothetical protein
MVGLELKLDGRGADRVTVSLQLSPLDEGPAALDGAALQLLAPDGEELCPRMLLPISGALTTTLTTTIELRSTRKLPMGCEVVATAWLGPDVVTERCPADPFTTLRDHVRGSRISLPDPDDVELDVAEPGELAALIARMPWIQQPLRAPEPTAVIEMQEEPSVADLQEDFGLEAEEAEWLKDLLDEPDA